MKGIDYKLLAIQIKDLKKVIKNTTEEGIKDSLKGILTILNAITLPEKPKSEYWMVYIPENKRQGFHQCLTKMGRVAIRRHKGKIMIVLYNKASAKQRAKEVGGIPCRFNGKANKNLHYVFKEDLVWKN